MDFLHWESPSSSNPSSSFQFLGPTSSKYLFTTVLRLRDALHRRRSSPLKLQSIFHFGDGQGLMNMCRERLDQFQWSFNAFSGTSLMSSSFVSGDVSRRDDHSDTGKSQSPLGPFRRDWFEKSKWTNIIIASNVLVYLAQTVSNGRVFYWGAKINSLISQGQLWRLVTSSFLHADILHLMVNCYSLHVVGPSVEDICGPKRYLAIYMASAVASSAMSYRFLKAPSVGASGAIFGLVGSSAVYYLRHMDILEGTEKHLKQTALVLLLNMAIGLTVKRIDNWGHLGGLIGGAAVTWLVGPAWKVQSISNNGKQVVVDVIDKAPIYSVFRKGSNQSKS